MKNLDLLIPKVAEPTDRFAWATITDVDPLRIRLDGELAPLDITPDSLIDVGWADVDRRVWVQISGRRVVILGQSGKPALEIPEIPEPEIPDEIIRHYGTGEMTTVGSPFSIDMAQLTRMSGLVTLTCRVARSTGFNGSFTKVGNIPAGYRPPATVPILISAASAAGTNAKAQVLANGDLEIATSSTNSNPHHVMGVWHTI